MPEALRLQRILCKWAERVERLHEEMFNIRVTTGELRGKTHFTVHVEYMPPYDERYGAQCRVLASDAEEVGIRLTVDGAVHTLKKFIEEECGHPIHFT